MASTGRDGVQEQSHSVSSSSSGTIISTTNTSSTSPLSCGFSMEAALHLDLGIYDDDNVSREETEGNSSGKRQLKRIQCLVQEFFCAPSANGGDISVLERWLAELGVAWVLRVTDAAPSSGDSGELERPLYARSWILALAKIMEGLRCTVLLFEEELEAGNSILDLFLQFARFMQEAVLRMLSFVDAMVALDPNGVPALECKISILLRVRGALSEATCDIEGSFLSTSSQEVDLIGNEMLNLFRAKDGKAGEAIWSTLEEIRSRCLLELMKDSSGGRETPQEPSSGIHKVTMSVMDHITFLLDNYSSLSRFVSEAASQLQGNYMPHQIGHQPHLDTMIIEMASCLEEKLSNMSESLPDQGLRFLFLLNNSDFIRERLQCNSWNSSSLQAHAAALLGKLEGYMDSYLQVSWAPVLSCLSNPTPLCLFGKYYYPPPLPKFESEFQKMYTTQKLWKVPDPELRTRLRTAITEEIITGYTKYVEDNITTPRICPQELEGMLQELFEG